MNPYRVPILWALLLGCCFPAIGQGITSIVTANETRAATTHTGLPGAGHRNASGVLSSLWDSTGTSFNVRYGVGPVQRTTITQFTVSGYSGNFISTGVRAKVRIRRSASTYVGSAGMHYNFWMAYDTLPPSGATTGTFLLRAQAPTSDTALMASSNLLAGLDNVFQNTNANLHSGNIERLDVLLNQGLTPMAYDLTRAGMVVFDRGTGDTFRMAAITGIDANGDPLTYGPMIGVSAGQFGNNLLGAAQPMIICTNDQRWGTMARPSSISTQNIRGTFVTLSALGIAAGQTFYGYSLFPLDVATASTNWNTQPTNTNSGNQIDPVAFFGVFKEVTSTLAVNPPLPSRSNANSAERPALWPNPATSTIALRGLPRRGRWQLLNVAGLSLGTYSLPGGRGTLSVGHLPAGVYFLREEGGAVLQFVKK